MDKLENPSKTAFAVAVEKDKDYYWCSCGRSRSQPFCNGSHEGGKFLPIKYTAEESKTVYFCGCKKTRTRPLCDGTCYLTQITARARAKKARKSSGFGSPTLL